MTFLNHDNVKNIISFLFWFMNVAVYHLCQLSHSSREPSCSGPMMSTLMSLSAGERKLKQAFRAKLNLRHHPNHKKKGNLANEEGLCFMIKRRHLSRSVRSGEKEERLQEPCWDESGYCAPKVYFDGVREESSLQRRLLGDNFRRSGRVFRLLH